MRDAYIGAIPNEIGTDAGNRERASPLMLIKPAFAIHFIYLKRDCVEWNVA